MPRRFRTVRVVDRFRGLGGWFARMPLRVSIADEQTVLAIERRQLRTAVRRTLRGEGVAAADVSLAVVDDPTMQALNRRHLQHDYPTDVLSFLLSAEGPRSTHDVDETDGGRTLEGELIVSTETAVRQAADYGWSPQAELLLYVVHGTLHLCGYDDHTAADRRRMRERERAVLQFWGLQPEYRE